MTKTLLNLINKILNLCDLVLAEKISPNLEVINLIKNEFKQQYDSLIRNNKAIVLNKKRDIWAAKAINDSADFGFDNDLFEMVFNFEKLCKTIPIKDLIILYD